MIRRSLLLGALVASAGGAWATFSSSWTARFFRSRLVEMGRAPAPAPHRPTPAAWAEDQLTLSWLGQSTVLINFHGVRILTDPVLFNCIGVDFGLGTLGPLRLTAPALHPHELPELDLVLVSHAHFDHLDVRSLAALRGRPVVVTARKTSDLIPRRPFSEIHELGWNEALTLRTPRGTVRVHGLEVQHWGARMRRDTYRGYNGYAIEREGRRLLFAGDTAHTPVFAAHRAHGPFDAALMPIGAYNPWIRNHCTPEQAVAMMRAAKAQRLVPLHHQTFKFSNEPFDEPLARLEAALADEPQRLALRAIGQQIVIPA
ncbi:MAG: hypothetical protein EXS22_05615 [Pedosphaera sp.]|nr:hypothetical protein [Pedosphaera sp.]MSU43498.1 hypothetical protein [Pedosphaera sp.]